jgi:hypothetical protein
VSKKPPRCDACNRRIRKNHHELVLRDFETEQVLGCYHARPGFQAAATKYIVPGVVLRGTYYHPERCGGEALEHCDGWLSESAA